MKIQKYSNDADVIILWLLRKISRTSVTNNLIFRLLLLGITYVLVSHIFTCFSFYIMTNEEAEESGVLERFAAGGYEMYVWSLY